MIKVVSVKFKDGGKPYYFAPGKDEYQKGMGVIVETSKGLEYATVVCPEAEVEDSEIVTPLKPVVRVATARDEEQVKRNRERRGEALKTAQAKIAERGLDMKLVDCEFAFDGSKVAFFFTAESRVDFRELIKDLSSAFHMRIELRQINIREEIKITGGLAPCGRECCCIRCMPEPLKVSVKMAKNQGLSLNPGKISGLCGRLMCCLAYENDYYAEVCKKVPKLGSEVETPDGTGTVVNVNMLKMQVKVKIEQNDAVSYHDFAVDDIRFMRGNVVMGRENFDEDDDADEESEVIEEKPEEKTAVKPEEKNGENRNKKKKNRDRNGQKQNRADGGNNNGENRNQNNGGNVENRENRGNNNGNGHGNFKGDKRKQNAPNTNNNAPSVGNAPAKEGENAQHKNNKNRNRHRHKPNGGGQQNPPKPQN
ncbi:MAG: stage 0 sporulation family protein [Clostridia bacterium]|nr:stage 0 sporulation family protein [Clostridia bacterium]